MNEGQRLGGEIQAALKRRDWRAGLALLETWCERYPNHAPGWLWRAQCLAETGAVREALGAARRAASLAPEDERIAHLVARLGAASASADPAAPYPQAPPPTRRAVPPSRQGRVPARPGKAAPAEGSTVLWKVGDLIDGRYEVEGVARGGMGEVYLVQDRELGARIAVKTPLPSTLATAAGRARFLREAEAWISLGLHPNICSAYYVREIGGVPRLFIELVDGGNLAEWLREHRGAPLEVRLDLAIQVAAGMHHAHTFEWRDEDGTAQRGVVHRDLKPANVLLDSDGVARVTDFGLVGRGAGEAEPDEAMAADGRLPDDTTAVSSGGVWSTMTMGGAVMGTPPYMPPEQWGGAHLAGKSADIYAFGCILYELLCGRRPFVVGPELEGALPDVVRIQWRRLHKEVAPPDPRTLVADLDPELARIMTLCLAKDPDDRPAAFDLLGRELRAAYQRCLGRPYPWPEPQAARLVADALNNRGVSFATLGQTARAEAAWQDALRADPHHVEASFNLSLHEWRRRGASDAATRQRMEEVCLNQPLQWRDDLLAGRIHLCTGDYAAAVERLRRALQAAGGGTPEAARACAFALCARSKVTGDREMLREAASILSRVGPAGRTDPAVLTTFAHVLDLLGEEERPQRLYARARRQRPDLPAELGRGAQRMVPGSHIGKPLTAFVGRALAAALSRDGRLGLTRAEDGSLTLWELDSSTVLRTIRAEGQRPRCHALGPEGTHAYTVADAEALVVSNPRTGALERRLPPHTGFVNALAVSPDGARVAGVGSTGSVIVWQLGDRPGVSEIPAHSGFGTALAWAGDGHTLASGGSDGTIAVVDVEARSRRSVMTGHRGAVTALAVNADASRVLSGGDDGTIRLWAAGTGECQLRLEGHSGPVTFVALHRARDSCLSGSADGTLRLWDLEDAELRLSTILVNGVTGGAATPDWRRVLVAHGTEVAQLSFAEVPELLLPWAVSTPTTVSEAEDRAAEFRRHLDRARDRLDADDVAAAAAAVEKARAVQGYERASDALELAGTIATPFPVLSLASAWEERCLRGHSDRVTALALSPDGARALSVGADRQMLVWDPASGTALSSFAEELFELAVVFVGDGRRAASAGLDNVIQIWDINEGGCLRALEGHEAKVFALAVGPRGRRLVSVSGDETGRVWDADRGVCTAVLEGHGCQVLCVAVSPTGRHAVSGGMDGSLLVWDLATGSAITGLPGHTGPVHGVAWSGDGRWLLSGGRDATVRLWEVARGACACTLEGVRAVTAVALSPDGHMALAGGEDTAVRLWDLRRRECLRTFSGHDGAVSAVVFAPGGRRYLSASADSTIRVWYLDWTPDLKAQVDWDDRVRPYLDVFLSRHGGPGRWSPEDTGTLIDDLRQRGLGFVRPQGVLRRLEGLAASGAVEALDPGGDSPRLPPTRRSRRRSSVSPRALGLTLGGIAVAVLLLLVWRGVSLSRLDLNDHEVARSRRRVFESVIPAMPQVARQTRCEPAEVRAYLKTFVHYENVDEWDRMKARHCLEVLADPRTVPPILSMVRPVRRDDARGRSRVSRDRSASAEVVSVLVRMGDGTTSVIVDALTDRDRAVRRVAASALAFRGSEAAVDALVERASHPEAAARIAVSGTLREIVSSGKLGRGRAFALFEDLAADGEWEVRRNVADALDIFTGSRARRLVVRLAQDAHPEVQNAAVQTMQSMRQLR